MSDSNKPTSLADELIEMVWGIAESVCGMYEATALSRHSLAETLARTLRERQSALRSRLQSLESELEELRAASKLWVPRPSIEGGSAGVYANWMSADRTFIPPRVEDHKSLVNEIAQESQRVGEWNSPGPYVIEGNTFEGSFERPMLIERTSGLPCSSTIELGDGTAHKVTSCPNMDEDDGC